MQERELLELAAKAAGMKRHPYFNDLYASDETETVRDMGASWESPRIWDPWKNDGDALRLLARLRELHGPILLAFFEDRIECGDCVDKLAEEPIGDYLSAATRRAIVRAAAAIQQAKEAA